MTVNAVPKPPKREKRPRSRLVRKAPKKRNRSAAEFKQEQNMTETWKPVEGWPYEVSDMGRVRSLGGRRGAITGRILKPQKAHSRGGGYYEIVALRDCPRNRTAKIHHLVLEAFIGPRPTPRHQCNHINGNKLDNRRENLEWVTCSENVRHALATGLMVVAPRNVKIGANNVPLIRARHAAGEPIRTLAREYGVDQSTIGLIVKRRTWANIA